MPSTHMRTLPLLLLLASCSADGLPVTGVSDAGPHAPDLVAPLSCDGVPSAIDAWIAAHQSCAVDSDCTLIYTGCGLAGQCGQIASSSAAGATLSTLTSYWSTHCDGGFQCDCPGRMAAPSCNAGVCGERPLPERLPVGAPCASGVECISGYCLTVEDTHAWTAGYCTVPDCQLIDACPASSNCRLTDLGRYYCLADCDTLARKSDCRDGYSCCSGAGHASSVGGCAPASTLFCNLD